METKQIIVKDRENIKDEELSVAAQVFRKDGPAAFPTETMYGLGGNALDEDAAKKTYAVKGWPRDNPLIAHTSCAEELEPPVKKIPEAGRRLVKAFWPGPPTMIFPKSSKVPYGTTGSLDTVAVRTPDDPVANRLIALAEILIAAPSANTSGRPNPIMADHMWQDMNGRIEMIIDGGPVGIGVESTIVNVSSPVPAVLRPGVITMEMLREVLGEVTIDSAILGPMSPGVRPKAPSMKHKHYAPKADLTLVESGDMAMDQDQVIRMVETVRKLAEERCSPGFRVGIIYTNESASEYPRGLIRSIGARGSQASVAHNLYAVLGEFDDLRVDFILSESFTKDHLGQAIMNRLSKVAGYRIVRVQVGLGGKLGAGFGIQMSGSELKGRYQVNGKHKGDKTGKQTLGEVAAQKLLGVIQEKGYTAGDKLPTEAEPMELLGVGRNTVREVLRILMSRSIITICQGSGTLIPDKNGVADDPLGFPIIKDRRKLAEDLIQIRVMLEPPIAALVAQSATPEDVPALEAVLLELEECMERRGDYSEKNSQFHAMTAGCDRNLVMTNLVPVITDGVQVFTGSIRETEYENTRKARRGTSEAVRDRRPVDAQQAMYFHLIFNDIWYKDEVK